MEEIKIISEKPSKLRILRRTFPWSTTSVNLLLDLYEKQIDSFMSKHAAQGALWQKIYNQMLPKIPEKNRDIFTATKLKTKFQSLKNQFKSEYYSNADETKSQQHFPYFDKMNKMFTEFAMRRLNETNPLNETTDEQLKLMMSQVLDDDISDDNFQNDHQYINTSQSKCDLIMKKIDQIPENAKNIKVEKMRIDPNTPFNRNVSQKVIPKQRDSLIHSYHQSHTLSKRKLDSDLIIYAKDKKANSTEVLQPKISKKINSTDVYDDSRDYIIVEALDECELSNISMRHSKLIYNDQSSHGIGRGSTLKNVTNGSQLKDISNNRTYINKSSNSQKIQDNSKKTINDSSIQVISNETIDSLSIVEVPQLTESAYNFGDIPPINTSSDYESDSSYTHDALRDHKSVNQSINIHNETVKGNRPAIVPKNLLKQVQNFSDSTNNSLIEKLKSNPQLSVTVKENSSPPAWFKSFLNKYESDLKDIHNKLDQILTKQPKSPALEHPKVTQLKQQRRL